MFPILIDDKLKTIDYEYASTARTFPYMCGEKGTLHKKIVLFPEDETT